MKTFIAGALFAVAQVLAWFQSNSGIIGGWLAQNYIYVALVFGPIVSVLFATGTKMMYDEGITLWSIRFLTLRLQSLSRLVFVICNNRVTCRLEVFVVGGADLKFGFIIVLRGLRSKVLVARLRVSNKLFGWGLFWHIGIRLTFACTR